MSDPQDPAEGMVVSRIVIERTLQPDGSDMVYFIASDSEGRVVPLIETLGMLELARDGLLRPREDDDNGDDGEV